MLRGGRWLPEGVNLLLGEQAGVAGAAFRPHSIAGQAGFSHVTDKECEGIRDEVTCLKSPS